MALLSADDLQTENARFASEYSRDHKAIPLVQGELDSVFADIDQIVSDRFPAYNKSSAPRAQHPLRPLLLRLAVTQGELDAVDAIYPIIPDAMVTTFDEAAISAMAATFVSGTALPVSQIFAEDVVRPLVRRRSELAI